MCMFVNMTACASPISLYAYLYVCVCWRVSVCVLVCAYLPVFVCMPVCQFSVKISMGLWACQCFCQSLCLPVHVCWCGMLYMPDSDVLWLTYGPCHLKFRSAHLCINLPLFCGIHVRVPPSISLLDLICASSVASMLIALEAAMNVPLVPSGSINLRHLQGLIRFNGVSVILCSQLLSLLIVVQAVLNSPMFSLLCLSIISFFFYPHPGTTHLHTPEKSSSTARVCGGKGWVKITLTQESLPYLHSFAGSLIQLTWCLNLFNSNVCLLYHSQVCLLFI